MLSGSHHVWTLTLYELCTCVCACSGDALLPGGIMPLIKIVMAPKDNTRRFIDDAACTCHAVQCLLSAACLALQYSVHAVCTCSCFLLRRHPHAGCLALQCPVHASCMHPQLSRVALSSACGVLCHTVPSILLHGANCLHPDCLQYNQHALCS